MRRRLSSRRLLTVALASACILVLPSVAQADVFEPIQMVSRGVLAIPGASGQTQQTRYAHDPAISADGRYLAFDGYVGGYSGVWRRDLQSGEIAPVAVGRVVPDSKECEGPQPTCASALPSISADGRYVSFTTSSRLDPGLERESRPNVYVRDMSLPATVQEMEAPQERECERSAEPRACPFTLVSAVNGSGEALTYSPESSVEAGAFAAGRTAISANGEKVVFITVAGSNLAGTGTPAGQVAVRDLNGRETTLVSVEDDPATGLPKVPATPVSATYGNGTFGAVDLASGGEFPVAHRFGLQSLTGAAISADGTTVAWMGRDVFKQARMLPGEAAEREAPLYTEPLWRRIADGPLAPTRRVTGGSEPENPGCAASGEQTLTGTGQEALLDPCQGPFLTAGQGAGEKGVYDASSLQSVPQLSADGYTVAFLATGRLASLGQNYGLEPSEQAADLYVADMRGSESRRAALRPLTEINSRAFSGSAAVTDFAISPNGAQVAFTTQRISFPLGSPAYITQPMAAPEMGELFDVDLENDTLTRVTHGLEGEPSERPHKEALGEGRNGPYPVLTDGALSPSFTGDGATLAFSSTAANLAAGDRNTPAPGLEEEVSDGSDAFTVKRVLFSAAPVDGSISPAPVPPSVTPRWRLSVSARSLPDGRVILYVRLPAAGRLSAVARGRVIVARVSSSSRHRRGRSVRVRTLRLSSASRFVAPNVEGVAQLTLTLARPYRSLAGRGLRAAVALAFTAAGGPALGQTVPVVFVYRARHGHRHR